jgi:VirK protein
MVKVYMVSREINIGIVFVALAIGCGTQIAAAADIDTGYQKLEKAILNGKDIHLTIDLTACHVHGTDRPGPPVRGSLHLEGYMIEADQSIVFSTTHFTVKSDNTPVNEFLSFRVQPSGIVTARTRLLNASTYVVFHDEEFDCNLGKGMAFHW